jgi:transposase
MGLDAHKSFCQIHILHPNGRDAYKGRINQCDYKQRFAELVAQHCNDHPCKATFESSTNWHVLYDLLSAIGRMEEVIMAHPLHVKYICQAQLKNDKVDALKLAQLLRLGMIPRAHATGPQSRHIKELVRQRAAFVQRRTALRNRTHRVLGACPEHIQLPQCSDLFGVRGIKAMKALQLPEPHQTLLRQNLKSLDELAEKIKECEQQLIKISKETASIKLLQSMPGLGKVLACVIAAEVDGIERFDTKKKFIGYCGLAPMSAPPKAVQF